MRSCSLYSPAQFECALTAHRPRVAWDVSAHSAAVSLRTTSQAPDVRIGFILGWLQLELGVEGRNSTRDCDHRIQVEFRHLWKIFRKSGNAKQQLLQRVVSMGGVPR
jgi:hypothetical protein